MTAIFKTFAIGALLLSALFWLPAELFARPLLGLFGLSESTLQMAVPNFRILYSIFIVYGIMIMLMTFFQSIGDGKTAGLLVMLRQLLLFIPAVLLLPLVFGASGLWYVLPLVDGIVVLLGLQRYFATTGKFKDR